MWTDQDVTFARVDFAALPDLEEGWISPGPSPKREAVFFMMQTTQSYMDEECCLLTLYSSKDWEKPLADLRSGQVLEGC